MSREICDIELQNIVSPQNICPHAFHILLPYLVAIHFYIVQKGSTNDEFRQFFLRRIGGEWIIRKLGHRGEL